MTFDFIPTNDGLRIHDQIENTHLVFGGDISSPPTSTDPDQFRAPVDSAVSFETSHVSFELLLNVVVHSRNRPMEELTFGDLDAYPRGSYELEIRNQSFKCYVKLTDASFTIDATGNTTVIDFDESVPLELGVRSYHESPAGIVTTTMDPAALATAISTFGSAMKTHSPERSWPTLRGHPPDVTIGTTISIPDGVSIPETGIVIEVPPDVASISTVAPLAYYLAAKVEVGERPALHTAGTTHEFDQERLSESVLELLRHCFLMDCIVRTEGLYEAPLKERRVLESRIPLDAARLYGLPLAERTMEYLSIPQDVLPETFPWPQLTHLTPSAESIPLLPYLAYSMSAIKSPPTGERIRPRNGQDSAAGMTRSFGMPALSSSDLVEPAPSAALHTAWVGDQLPIAGSRPTLSSFVSSRQPSPDDGAIHVNLVCNDPDMSDELVDAYGSAELDCLTVTTHTDLTVEELRSVIGSRQQFLHYIGHIEADGLRCADGSLDVRTITDSGVESFLLNGCASVEQGFTLLNRGSIFGIVTTDFVQNETAIQSGRTVARLLDRGFTPADALSIISWHRDRVSYSILGDANHRLCPAEDSATCYAISSTDIRDESVKAVQFALPNAKYAFGGMLSTRPAPSTSLLHGPHELIFTRSTLETLAETTTAPLFIDDELHWFDQIDPDEIWPLLESKRTEATD